MSELRIIVCKNGHSNGAEIGMPSGCQLDDLLQRSTDALRLPDKATRLFRITGVEVSKPNELDDGEFVFVSSGEDFIPVGGDSILNHSSVIDIPQADNEIVDDKSPIGFKDLPPAYQEHLLHTLEEGEEVKWTGRPVLHLSALKNILICLSILGFAGVMSGLIDEWRVTVYLFCITFVICLVIMTVWSTLIHEYYAITNKRIIILHAGCCCGVLWMKKDVKKSPVFSKLTNFHLEIEYEFGLGNVWFRSTRLGFSHLRDARIAARNIKSRLPEAPPKTQIMF